MKNTYSNASAEICGASKARKKKAREINNYFKTSIDISGFPPTDEDFIGEIEKLIKSKYPRLHNRVCFKYNNENFIFNVQHSVLINLLIQDQTHFLGEVRNQGKTKSFILYYNQDLGQYAVIINGKKEIRVEIRLK